MAIYTENPTSFEEMVAPFNADVRSIADALRALIRETLPDFDENIYGGLSMANALYGACLTRRGDELKRRLVRTFFNFSS